jgi:hypothetical protein
VISGLRNYGVPDNCWWSCDGVFGLGSTVSDRRLGKPCDRCGKCEEIAEARGEGEAFRKRQADRLVAMGTVTMKTVKKKRPSKKKGR